MNNTENNKRIAKNATFLFFRMFLILGVSLYTTRIVLEALGFEDYGIYNVVGGVVFMMAFLTSSLSSATQRFLSFELGKKDYLQLNKVFSMSINIYIILALFIFVLAETIGIWFLDSKMNIPVDRVNAANWVYQFSVFTFIINILIIPYNATIISQERMKIFTYISIFEAILKLIIVFILFWVGGDKLEIYAVLIFLVSIMSFIIYIIYCNRNFPSSIYVFLWDKKLFKLLINFSGWNLFGGLAGVSKGQGVNLLLNFFFGPTVNAARGLSFQISGAVNMFVVNFQTAINPQIIKSYAHNDIKYMHRLIFQGSKFSFFLLYVCSLPVLLELDSILPFLLKKTPHYTVVFTKLAIINILIDSLSSTLMTGSQASGNIKKYQATLGSLLMLNVPFSYVLLYMGYPPQYTLYVSIFISVIAMYIRVLFLRVLIELPGKDYFFNVIIPVILVLIFSLFFPLILKNYFIENAYRPIIVILCSIISSLGTIYFIGLTHSEKTQLKQIIRKYIK